MGVDLTVLRTAATGGLLFIVGAVVLSRIFAGSQRQIVPWIFLAVVLGGFALAGAVAGRLRTDRPLLHGSLAALLCALVALGCGVALNLADSKSVSVAAVASAAALLASISLFGGAAGALASDRMRRQSLRNKA